MNRILRVCTVLLASMFAVLLFVGPASATPTAPAKPWGACGNSTPDAKLVRQFPMNNRLNYYLRCGNADFGYRHIALRHRTDFQNLAAGTNTNWRDVADLAMEAISSDPDVARPAGDGKACLNRVIFLKNNRTNQVVRQQNIRMFVVIASGDIITAYPDVRNCP